MLFAGEPGGLLVFAVVVALQLARRMQARSLRGQLAELAFLPVIGIVTALYGELLRRHQVAGDALVVASVYASFATRRSAPVVARAGRLLMLPVLVLFVAPVPPQARGGEGVLWYLAASLIAGASVVAVDRLLAVRSADRALRRALVEVVGLATSPPSRRLRRAAARLDAQLAVRGPAADPLRVALFQAEIARLTGDEAGADTSLAVLREAAAAGVLPGHAGSIELDDAPPPAAPSGRRISPSTRVAGQSAIALALAFAISQWLFPDHWAWTVVSVLAISGGLRSRGDVLLRSGERLVGALLGTLVATLLAAGLAGERTASIVAILVLLAFGSLLREASYAIWAFCVTSMLALVYGLYGEHGTHLLGERLIQNVIGALCLIVPSYFLLPIRTESVVRRRLGAALAALGDVLAALGDDAPAPRLVELARTADRRVDELEDAARAAVVHGHGLRIARRTGRPRAVALTEGARAGEDAARALVYVSLSGRPPPSRATLGVLRRNLGELRRTLAGRGTEPLAPLPVEAEHDGRLNAALRELHAAL